ncbi:MAG: hypothetical protein J7549_17360 [Variovorax sp.]|nr:hypothetical protein [Variovorax sp.]
MSRGEPRTALERVLAAMKSPAAAFDVRLPHPACVPAPGDRSPCADRPRWTVQPYLCAREIRVAWSADLLRPDGTPCDGGLWHLDTDRNRRLLTQTVAEGQRLFGITSHWLEERDA